MGDGTNGEQVRMVTQHSVRVPQFWPQKIELWFKLLEAQFTTAKINDDATMFNIAIAHISEQYIEQIEDVVLSPPVTEKFKFLKGELVKRLTESDSTRVRKLMESEEMGDRTPSQFYRDLKKLALPSITDEVILAIWRSRLPANSQRVLAATTETKAQALTEMADRIHEIKSESGRIAAVSQDSELSALREEIKQLKLQISEVKSARHRSVSRGRKRDTSKNRSATPGPAHASDDGRVCWYHWRFKEKATKCRPECPHWKSGNE